MIPSILPTAASSYADKVDPIFWAIFGISGFFSTLIFVLLLYCAIRFRRSQNPQTPAETRTITSLEITWAVVPALIMLFFFYWGARVFIGLYEGSTEQQSPYEVYVLGKQWMWKFQHANGVKEIDQLHLPAKTPIKLTLISQDVIHDWFVPAFRLKRDVLPMHYEFLSFYVTREGNFPLYCAEYCGTKHSQMRGEVIALRQDQFASWLDSQNVPVNSTAIANAGEALLEQYSCRGCHEKNSTGRAPILEGLYGSWVPLSDGKIQKVDANYLRESIISPAAKIHRGYQSIMPSYRGQISEDQIITLIHHLRELSEEGATDGT